MGRLGAAEGPHSVLATAGQTAPIHTAADRDWPVYLGDAGGTHYSALAQIDRGNVVRLAPAWTYRTGDATANSQIQCNPLVVDGVLYGTSPQLALFASRDCPDSRFSSGRSKRRPPLCSADPAGFQSVTSL